MSEVANLPDDFPRFLRWAESDAPVPTWEQVTRARQSIDPLFVAHISRIVAGTEDEEVARGVWDAWPPDCRRSVGILIDKICHEGWLDSVGPIKGRPWDGGFFFWPRHGHGELASVLSAKAAANAGYIECCRRAGFAAWIARRDHGGWKRSWIENDSPVASLHIGIFDDGSAEVHLDLFNPLYAGATPASGLVRLPLIGPFNHKLFRLHMRWDRSDLGSVARRSANFYHLMRDRVPLSF